MLDHDTSFLCFLYVRQMKVTHSGSASLEHVSLINTLHNYNSATLCPTFLLLQQSLQLHNLNFGLYELNLLPLKLMLCFEQGLIAK